MKSLANPTHELLYSPERDMLFELAQKLPELFDDLRVFAAPDRTNVSYSGIPVDNSDEVEDAKLALSYECEGTAIRSYEIVLTDGEKPYYFARRKPNGEWGVSDLGEPASDSDVLSFMINQSPEPKIETAKLALAIELDNPSADDVIGFAENVLRYSADKYTTIRDYKANCERFTDDGYLEWFQVELSHIKEGQTFAKEPKEFMHLLHVTRPTVIGGVPATEHLQLSYNKWGTGSTDRFYDLPGGKAKRITIDDSSEFLQQMQTALEYLLEQKSPLAEAA